MLALFARHIFPPHIFFDLETPPETDGYLLEIFTRWSSAADSTDFRVRVYSVNIANAELRLLTVCAGALAKMSRRRFRCSISPLQ